MIRIEIDGGGPGQLGGDVKVQTRRRWYRLAAYLGEAAGSHTGLWRTSTGPGGPHGWNYRVGSVRRCLTVLAHTRAARS
ncbi:MAG: hypothetical protein JWO98_2060 [Frankiales bacterium]|nr:hypothetical protein [Frankiales bacterium]